MKKVFSLLSLLLVTFFFTACTNNQLNKPISKEQNSKNIFQTNINYIIDQLLENGTIDPKVDTLSLTTFIDLDQSNKTSFLGRKLSNGIYDELIKRGFKVKDVRETKTFVVKPDGELVLSNDPRVLNKKRVENSYLIVATYSSMNGGTLVNARILDHLNGQVISFARTLINMNQGQSTHQQVQEKAESSVEATAKRTIKLSDADCKDETCKKEVQKEIEQTLKKEVQKKQNEKKLSQSSTSEEKQICDYR